MAIIRPGAGPDATARGAATKPSARPWRRRLAEYGVAALAVVLATALRVVLDPLLGNNALFSTYYLAVAFAAWYGGLRPSLFALVLGAVVATFTFVPPRGSFAIQGAQSIAALVLYLVLGGLIALLCGSLVASRRLVQEQRRWLAIMLAGIDDAVIAVDAEGHVTSMNSAAETLSGWSPHEAIGQPLEAVFRIVEQTNRRPVADPLARVLREGVVIGLTADALLITKHGVARRLDDRAVAIRDRKGNVEGVVLVFRERPDMGA
jgi:PAS domain S-box-containing protein